MHITSSLLAFAVATVINALPPSVERPTGCQINHTHTFGMYAVKITPQLRARRVSPLVSQISDGQLQAATTFPISQISDGQLQVPPSASSISSNGTTHPSSNKGSSSSRSTKGNSGKTTNTIPSSRSYSSSSGPSQMVSQIDDGQIQAFPTRTKTPIYTSKPSTKTMTTPPSIIFSVPGLDCTCKEILPSTPISQHTATMVTQATDGQVQAPLETPKKNTISARDQCKEGTLAMTLQNGTLTDSEGRIGSIVSNFQFQFDGPPPQSGALRTTGWSVCSDGILALDGLTTFYECNSGGFSNLYDRKAYSHCEAVRLTTFPIKC